MTDLPDGWELTTFGEIAETSLGKMLDKGKSSGKHLRPYLRNVNVQWGRIDQSDVLLMEIPPEQADRYRLRAGDLLVCEGGEIGRCGVWSGSEGYMAYQKALHRVRPLGGVDPVYLRYLLEHLNLRGVLARLATGSTIKHLPQEQLRRVPAPLPPLAEQRRIVAVLEGHLSCWESGASQIIALARRIDRFRDQVMFLAGVGRLVARAFDAHAAPPHSVGVQDGELPLIPNSWQWRRLGEIADVVGGVTKDSKRQSDPDFVEAPYLRVANVQRARLNLSEVARIKVPPRKAEQLRLQAGDVLLNEGGDRDKLGRGWIWEEQIPGCIHQNHVFRARLRDGVLHPKLLAWHANGFGRHWFEVNGLQSVNLASISLGKMKKFPVPVPPVSEQEKLVQVAEEYLTLLDRMEGAVAAAREKAARLRASLLADAFAGRLVPQDPNDEPASELLARIRAERAVSVPKQRTRARRTAKELPAPPTRVTGDDYQQEALPL